MIIKINQIKAGTQNEFEIKINNETKYLASTPWSLINIHFDFDKKRKLNLTDINGSVIFTTTYGLPENILNDAMPYKWVFGVDQKNHIYTIKDKNSKIVSTFYSASSGPLDKRYMIKYKNTNFIIYRKSVGQKRHLLIYKDDTQIADIIKPLITIDNKDNYYIFLLDEYEKFKEILVFFTIYFDYMEYSHSGEIKKGAEMRWAYTWDKNNKRYDKFWLSNNFKKEDLEFFEQEISTMKKEFSRILKKTLKFLAWFFGILILLLGIYSIIVFL